MLHKHRKRRNYCNIIDHGELWEGFDNIFSREPGILGSPPDSVFSIQDTVGQAALKMAETQKKDLIITDLKPSHYLAT